MWQRGLSGTAVQSEAVLAATGDMLLEKLLRTSLLEAGTSYLKEMCRGGFVGAGTETLNTLADYLVAGRDSRIREAYRSYLEAGKTAEEAKQLICAAETQKILRGFLAGATLAGTANLLGRVLSKGKTGKTEIDKPVQVERIEKVEGKGRIKTSYGKSTLNSLKNTENFTDSAIEHIFEGQVNARGKAVGYHYEGIEGTSGNVIPGTESSVNNIGVYKAQVEVNGIPKTANGGFSTFYSKNLSPQQVVDAINEAYSNCELKLGTRNTYQGVANNGVKIDMFLDQSGKIISAFPEE